MKKQNVEGIARDTLRFILEVSRDTLPCEFAGVLQAENGVITEVLLLPGTESGERQATLKLYMLPNMHIVGSVHSHPSRDIRPSKEDLAFFGRIGDYNIIAGVPFSDRSWACYDRSGKIRPLPVLDVDLTDEEVDI